MRFALAAQNGTRSQAIAALLVSIPVLVLEVWFFKHFEAVIIYSGLLRIAVIDQASTLI